LGETYLSAKAKSRPERQGEAGRAGQRQVQEEGEGPKGGPTTSPANTTREKLTHRGCHSGRTRGGWARRPQLVVV